MKSISSWIRSSTSFKELQSENTQMKNELATLREQARKVKEAEDTIMNTLVSAQKSAERIITDASRKAELIISSAGQHGAPAR